MEYTYRSRQKKTNYLLVIIFIIGVILLYRQYKQQNTIISPLADDNPIKKIINLPKSSPKAINKNPAELISRIKKLTDTKNGYYSVYIYDLTNDQAYGFNETTILTAASVNKIPVLAALYYEAQTGRIDLDKRITLQASDIQDFGTGILRNEKPGGLYSLKTLAQIMIEKSDNTAVYVLTQVIGEKKIQELVNKWGLTQTDIKNNKTSNKDMALLFTKIYRGQIANAALTIEMIGFMDDSDFENRLPALLPDTVKVYHKIGTEIGNIHDVGIIALERHPYYLGVMTNDVTDEQQAETTIAEISQMVYDFMSST